MTHTGKLVYKRFQMSVYCGVGDGCVWVWCACVFVVCVGVWGGGGSLSHNVPADHYALSLIITRRYNYEKQQKVLSTKENQIHVCHFWSTNCLPKMSVYVRRIRIGLLAIFDGGPILCTGSWMSKVHGRGDLIIYRTAIRRQNANNSCH